MKDIKLPTLTTEDIDKLDNLLAFLKENNKDFINISTYCSQTFGDNGTLYFCFANLLNDNGLTHPKTGYIWSQIISQEGLAFDGFKKEYSRQSSDKQ